MSYSAGKVYIQGQSSYSRILMKYFIQDQQLQLRPYILDIKEILHINLKTDCLVRCRMYVPSLLMYWYSLTNRKWHWIQLIQVTDTFWNTRDTCIPYTRTCGYSEIMSLTGFVFSLCTNTCCAIWVMFAIKFYVDKLFFVISVFDRCYLTSDTGCFFLTWRLILSLSTTTVPL